MCLSVPRVVVFLLRPCRVSQRRVSQCRLSPLLSLSPVSLPRVSVSLPVSPRVSLRVSFVCAVCGGAQKTEREQRSSCPMGEALSLLPLQTSTNHGGSTSPWIEFSFAIFYHQH